MSVGLLDDVDLSEPEQKGHCGVDQETKESALPLVSKGKRTHARSGQNNSSSECKEAGLSRRTRSKQAPAVTSCGQADVDDRSDSSKSRSRHTRRSSLPSARLDSEFRVYSRRYNVKLVCL